MSAPHSRGSALPPELWTCWRSGRQAMHELGCWALPTLTAQVKVLRHGDTMVEHRGVALLPTALSLPPWWLLRNEVGF